MLILITGIFCKPQLGRNSEGMGLTKNINWIWYEFNIVLLPRGGWMAANQVLSLVHIQEICNLLSCFDLRNWWFGFVHSWLERCCQMKLLIYMNSKNNWKALWIELCKAQMVSEFLLHKMMHLNYLIKWNNSAKWAPFFVSSSYQSFSFSTFRI